MINEQRLWIAVVAQAISDLGEPGGTYDFAKTCREVESELFGFVCEMAAVPQSKVLKYMRQLKAIRGRANWQR